MAPRILLQPGQIWTPQDSRVPCRRIVDLSERVLAYSPFPDTDAPSYENVSQSFFRRWIRESRATLSGQTEARAAPATELAKKVATLRKACGMSQSELAAAMGLSRSAIAALETGRTSSANRHLPKLAQIFEVPPELFLGGMVEQTTTMDLSPDERDLIDLYRRLPTERKMEIQKYAERRARA
ncbi:helix-turn-helix domain-containing protein [Gluconacetobacter entanii]|uniref:Transcriptional regulator n=1 Tax=Gluconacetobacter entanii TaxID=108528 RepID=A0A318PXN6_9PROT|nr:helix-turn-helix domain-containing protein [Gluconacetobacter entanii]MCE2579443.1 helix-turn-helix domain-containing protein [Komagataeibacter sp. FNDCR1]PYD63106.1 transcriptional regulator [Gluconacetobacter entanii]